MGKIPFGGVTDNEGAEDENKVEVEVEAPPPKPQLPDESSEIDANITNSSSNKLFSARVIPFLLLIILPFGIGILLPYFFPFFRFRSPFEFQDLMNNPNLISSLKVYSLVPIGMILTIIFKRHYHLYSRNYFERRGYENAINEYDYINKLVYIDILMIVILTFLFYVLPEPIKKSHLQLLLGNGFYFLQSTLIFSVYAMFVILYKSYSRRDFRFQFAKVCMDIVEKSKTKLTRSIT